MQKAEDFMPGQVLTSVDASISLWILQITQRPLSVLFGLETLPFLTGLWLFHLLTLY